MVFLRKLTCRLIPQKESACSDEFNKRQLKVVVDSPEKRRPNPITEGEPDKPVKSRVVGQQVSEWTRKFNEKASLLPCERSGNNKS